MRIIKTQNENKLSWLGFFRHVVHLHIFESSATLSYYFLFSVFPLTVFISAAISTLPISHEEIGFLSGLIPNNIVKTLENYLQEISTGKATGLIASGFFLTLYSMGKAIQTLKRKFRLSYGIKRKSKGITEWIISFVFVLLVMISFYAMLIVIVAGNQIIHWLVTVFPILSSAVAAFHWIRFLLITLYLFFVLFGLYYILPGIRQRKTEVLPGTLFALISWVCMSYLFSLYLERFSNLTSLYGSISTIIALMTWLFLINLILLFGVGINSYLHLNSNEVSHEKHKPVLH